ncbi:hypothetical protein IIC65_03930 [Candidatus Sumerlaeota bacterium]|nr:hypothetical protein [Candidatus Sumerlaeota bacterium]
MLKVGLCFYKYTRPSTTRACRPMGLSFGLAVGNDWSENTWYGERQGIEEPSRLVMGVRHKEFPITGVQFHPESILTGAGKQLLQNFLNSL